MSIQHRVGCVPIRLGRGGPRVSGRKVVADMPETLWQRWLNFWCRTLGHRKPKDTWVFEGKVHGSCKRCHRVADFGEQRLEPLCEGSRKEYVKGPPTVPRPEIAPPAEKPRKEMK